MGTIVFRYRWSGTEGLDTISGVDSWTVHTLDPSVVIGTSVAPNGYNVSFSGGGAVAVGDILLTTVTFPGTDLSTIGHIGVEVIVSGTFTGFPGTASVSSSTRFRLGFTATADDDVVTFTGMTEADFTFYLNPYFSLVQDRVAVAWGWDYGDGTAALETVNPSTHTYSTYPVSGFVVRLKVRDQYGLDSVEVVGLVYPTVPTFRQWAALATITGSLVTAANDTPDELTIRYSQRGSTEGMTLTTLPALVMPSLSQDGTGRIYLMGSNGTTGYEIHTSDNGARTWSYMATTPIPEGYLYADQIVLPTLGEIPPIVAMAIDPDTLNVLTWRSIDNGATWSDPVTILNAGESTIDYNFRLQLIPGTMELRLLNAGLGQVYQSITGGVDWTAL